MILAISGGTLFVLLLLVAVILCAYSVNKSLKISKKNKQKSQAMMNDLNVLMMTHEANKKKLAEKEEAQTENKTEAKINTKPSLKDDEKIRIKTLYEDAGMSAENIAAKIGKDISLIQEFVDNGLK